MARKPATKKLSTFTMKKNEQIALVYDVGGMLRGTPASRRALFEGPLRGSRATPNAARRKAHVLAEGDSWINILIELSAALGYEPTFFDMIEASGKYQTASVAYPGDTFEEMLQEVDYAQLLKSATFDYFIFSGGGNDVLGGGSLAKMLVRRDEADGTHPTDFLHEKILDERIAALSAGYTMVAKQTKVWSLPRRTRLLVHGYDYPVPIGDGPWLGRPFTAKGYDLTRDAAIIRDVLRHLVDRLYAMLRDIEHRYHHVTVVDLRNTVKNRWNDELHPKRAASADLAAKFMAIMDGPEIA